MNPYQYNPYQSGMDTSIPMSGAPPQMQNPMSTLASIYRMKRMVGGMRNGYGSGDNSDDNNDDPFNRLSGLRRFAAMHALSGGGGGGDDGLLGSLNRFATLHRVINGGGGWFGE